MEDKAKVDNVVGGLWRIHGKAYDFSSFAANHPGARMCWSAFLMIPWLSLVSRRKALD
jgi:hypothetical protein